MRAFFTIKLVTLKEIMMPEFDKVLGNITRYLSFLKTMAMCHWTKQGKYHRLKKASES